MPKDTKIPSSARVACERMAVSLSLVIGAAGCKRKIESSGMLPNQPPVQGPLQPAAGIEQAPQEKQSLDDGGMGAPVCELQYPLKKGTWTTIDGGRFKASRSYAGGHTGVDFAPYKSGEKIFATANGKVFLDPETKGAYGNRFSIEHPPCEGKYAFVSFFAHNSRNLAAVGSIVPKGELIAFTGNTGSASRGEHLHFDLENRRKDPSAKTGSGDSDGYFVNPEKFMDGYPQ